MANIFAQVRQTTPIMHGAGQPKDLDVRGYGFGRSRNGTKGRIEAAFAYGHDIAIGRGVVYSAQYNQPTGSGAMTLSVSLPDASGDHTVSPFNGKPLSDTSNAALFATQKVNGEYVFAGFVIAGEKCHMCECLPCMDWEYPECPVGNPDSYLRSQIAERNSALSVATHGEYMWVPSVVELKRGDAVALIDDPGADPCLNLLGAITAAGAGAIDLPERIRVSRDSQPTPNGGFVTEIYLG